MRGFSFLVLSNLKLCLLNGHVVGDQVLRSKTATTTTVHVDDFDSVGAAFKYVPEMEEARARACVCVCVCVCGGH